MNRISISISILFILVLLIYLPTWMTPEPNQTPEGQEEAWIPNYQARNMRSTLYDEDGEVNHEVYAQKMEHYQLLGFTLFRQPQYTIYVKNQTQPWHVVATEGTLYEDNRIQLETDVVIRSQTEEGFVRTIKSNFLEINLNDQTMTSDQPVEIAGQNFLINSNGFEGNLATLQFEFKEHVQTQFAAQ